MFVMNEDDFERLVADTIDQLPLQFQQRFENLEFIIECEPTIAAKARVTEQTGSMAGYEVLGLYSGISLTKRGFNYAAGPVRPDIIYIFKGPHFRVTNSLEELTERVRETIVHEVGHYFGMDEQQLKEMGYGSALA